MDTRPDIEIHELSWQDLGGESPAASSSDRSLNSRPDRRGSLTYEPYYGLREKPFSLAADPRFLYKGRIHAPVFDELLSGIRRREGLIVLTGDIGTGKTTLCRAVLEELDRKTFSAFIPDPFLSREDLLKMLLVDFGVVSVDDLRRGRLNGASRPDLSYPLYEFLTSLERIDAVAVLVIDEAQHLSTPLLEEIRILSEVEGREKLLQVVLVGQLELQTRLRLPEMRQVAQRVSVRCELPPLTRDGISAYVEHRLHVAGGSPDRVQFSSAALDLVCAASGGVPRVVNLICDRALQRASVNRQAAVRPEVVSRALEDLGICAIGLPVTADSRSLLEKGPVASDAPNELRSLLDMHPVAPSSAAGAAGDAAVPSAANDALAQFGAEDELYDIDEDESPLPVSWIGARWRPHLSARTLAGATLSVALVVLTMGIARRVGSATTPPFPPHVLSIPQASTLASVGAADIVRASRRPAVPTSPIAQSDAPQTPPIAPVPSTPGTSTPATYYVVQVATFSNAARAHALVAELRATTLPAYLVEIDGVRGKLHQVLLGRYGSASDANSAVALVRETPAYADALVHSVESKK